MGPDGQRGPDCPGVLFFVGFRTDFVTSVRFWLLPPEFWPSHAFGSRGLENPKRAQSHSLRPTPLGYVPVLISEVMFGCSPHMNKWIFSFPSGGHDFDLSENS